MTRYLIPACLIACLITIGCSDDDKPVAKDSAVVTKDGPVTKNEASVQKDGPVTKNEASVQKEAGTPTGACTNTADMALLDTAAKQTGVSAAAKKCGLGCISDKNPATCATTCVVKDTKLSAKCSACYVGIIMCTMNKCLADCAVDPDSKACTDCMTKNNCYTKFYTCSGLTPPATSDAGL